MGRIRSIKPEFFKSIPITELDPVTRLLFIGLWTYCDDAGRGVLDAHLIKADVFPRDDEITIADIDDMLDELSRRARIALYQVSDRPYFEVCNWLEHQKINNPSKPRCPDPSDGNPLVRDPTQDYPIPHLVLPEPSLQEQGTGSMDQGDNPSTAAPSTPAHFDDFWSTYPRRVGKQDAIRAWKKAIKLTTANEIITGAARYRDDPNRTAQFTAHPSTWLNDGRWDDETPEPERAADWVGATLAPGPPRLVDYERDDVPDALPMAAGALRISEIRRNGAR